MSTATARITDAANEQNEENNAIYETGDIKDVNMILGDRERVRYAGTVRPGIKIPVASTSKEQKDLYENLYADGVDFDTIDLQMLKLGKSTAKSVLRPVNIDHFIIRDCDFKNPVHAEYIRSKYANENGKVTRLPIWFHSNEISTAIPHNFAAFDGAHNSRCFSYYDNDVLKFKYLPKDHKGPAKPEDWLILDTEDEQEATKACGYKVDFGGRYMFFVEGIKSVGEIILPTSSWYGLGDGVAVLRRIRSVYGRFSGLFEGKPFLELVKTKAKVKTPEGKRVDQWIVTIETAVDMIELQRYAENKPSRGFAALQLLNGGLSKTAEVKPPMEPQAAGSLDVKQTVVAGSAANLKKESAMPSDKPDTGKTPDAGTVSTVTDTTSAASSSAAMPEAASKPTDSKADSANPGSSDTTTAAASDTATGTDTGTATVADLPLSPEVQKALTGLRELATKSGLNEAELNAYAEFKLRQPLAKETDFSRLQRLYGELKSRLQADKAAVKTKCQELIIEATSLEPEVEGMWVEFGRMADMHDITLDHLKAHLTALTGMAAEKMAVSVLQTSYREIEARLKRGNIDQFKREIAGNYRDQQKAA